MIIVFLYYLFFLLCLLQVECKKAQPKEVMLPTNLAKTRAAGRTAYGELVVLSGGPSTSNVGAVSSLRYAPYPLPASISGIQHHQHQQSHHQTAHIIPIATPTPSILQYTPQLLSSFYTQTPQLLGTSNKRLPTTAATATASSAGPTAATAENYLIFNRPPLGFRSHRIGQSLGQTSAVTPRATATLTYPLTELLGLQPHDTRTFFL